jgi:brefeldin A-inhibited guanine nucleotide-exchange protein
MSAWHASTTSAAAAAPVAEGSTAPSAAAAAAAGVEASGPAPTATTGEEAGADDSVLKSGWEARVAESGLGSAAGDGEQRQAALLESWKGYKRQFQQGVALFNQKPKKGIGYMQEQGLVGPAPDDVAQFLAKSQGLK